MRAAQAAMERTAPRDILESAGGTAAAAAEAERSGGICYIRATSRGPQRYVNGRWVSFSAAVPDDEAAPKGVKPWRYIEAIRMESHRKPNAGDATGCEISPDAQHLAMCIASRAESKGTRCKPVGTCFPGMRRLSQDTSRGRTYVTRLSSELQNAGGCMSRAENRASGGYRTSTQFAFPRPLGRQ